MKQLKKIIAATALLATVTGASASQPGSTRIMSYNIRNGVGYDNQRNIQRTANVVLRSQPDIVAIQEVDSVTGRSGGTYVLGDLAEATGMHAYFAPAIDYDGGKYGIGLLTREEPLSVKRVSLPGREEARALLIAEFPGYVAACTHLSLTPEDAMASVEIIRQAVTQSGKPAVVCGDLNSFPESDVIRSLERDFTRVCDNNPTFPAPSPQEKIDYIFVSRGSGAASRGYKVIDAPVESDHRPIIADITLPAPADAIIYHQPYLQNMSQDGAVTVMYQTRPLCTSSVEYGTDTLNTISARQFVAGQEAVHDIEHRVRLTGLTPGQRYFYRVRAREITENKAYHKTFGNESVTPWHTFTVPSPSQKDFTAAIVNDMHCFPATITAMAEVAMKHNPDFVVFNGDCMAEPATRMQAVHDIHLMADAFGLADRPGIFIRGNHEIRNAYSSGQPSLVESANGLTYGAFNWGDTRFVTLDCGEDKPDTTWVYYGLNDFSRLRQEQTDFLRGELSSKAFKKAGRRVLIHHIPVWGNTDSYRPCTDMWAPLLAKAPFDVNLTGHTHEYKRIDPTQGQNPFPVIVGGGYKLDGATVMILRRRGDEMTLTVLGADGRTIDTISL
ncbi:endonuclease [Paramuribaculum intestinale]|uniref:Endonuclease n=1 Tax=Paramuribaculum intestinale TaxID=2094151 RepID=A0A2V1J1R8_9BACT|nr:endonuclease/exonuclease/phosphatase family protein [Paramuribaculum intestinale]PWB08647.1 endonuclease [Paramuribaculum intestinale]PWB09906.1 endonuclease [Paramuribaculum intestinale]WLT41705.1 endonuclease/exonuclease/phosphatase family protein [Paramuribaculum intestinale]